MAMALGRWPAQPSHPDFGQGQARIAALGPMAGAIT
jgi:hypothetical protein